MPDCYDDIEENCDRCYEAEAVQCTALTFDVGISGTYYLNIVDKFSKIYTQQIDIVAGEFTIDQTVLPSSFFNIYAGAFELYIVNASGFTVPLTIGIYEYNCIILTIVDGIFSEWVDVGWVDVGWVN